MGLLAYGRVPVITNGESGGNAIMLPEIYQATAGHSFLKTSTAVGKEPIISIPNSQDGNFIQDAEDAIVDLIVTIIENRRKN